jgi:hypothetical protein
VVLCFRPSRPRQFQSLTQLGAHVYRLGDTLGVLSERHGASFLPLLELISQFLQGDEKYAENYETSGADLSRRKVFHVSEKHQREGQDEEGRGVHQRRSA